MVLDTQQHSARLQEEVNARSRQREKKEKEREDKKKKEEDAQTKKKEKEKQVNFFAAFISSTFFINKTTLLYIFCFLLVPIAYYYYLDFKASEYIKFSSDQIKIHV